MGARPAGAAPVARPAHGLDGSEITRAAFRQPQPLAQDLERYDENAENPLHKRVFDAWDAQFEEFWRQHRHFVPADDSLRARYAAALQPAEALDARQPQRSASECDAWIADCQHRIATWAGEGLGLLWGRPTGTKPPWGWRPVDRPGRQTLTLRIQ